MSEFARFGPSGVEPLNEYLLNACVIEVDIRDLPPVWRPDRICGTARIRELIRRARVVQTCCKQVGTRLVRVFIEPMDDERDGRIVGADRRVRDVFQVVVVVGLDCVRQVDYLLRPLNFV